MKLYLSSLWWSGIPGIPRIRVVNDGHIARHAPGLNRHCFDDCRGRRRLRNAIAAECAILGHSCDMWFMNLEGDPWAAAFDVDPRRWGNAEARIPEARQCVKNNIRIAKWLRRGLRRARVKGTVGLYGVIPTHQPVRWGLTATSYMDVTRRLRRYVDYLMPILHDNGAGKETGWDWFRRADQIITLGKMYGRPMYPHMIPVQWHYPGRPSVDYLDPELWSQQLQHVSERCAGAVVYVTSNDFLSWQDSRWIECMAVLRQWAKQVS